MSLRLRSPRSLRNRLGDKRQYERSEAIYFFYLAFHCTLVFFIFAERKLVAFGHMKKTLYLLLTAVLLAFFGIAHSQNTQWYGYAYGSFGGDPWTNKFISFDTQTPNSVQAVSETIPQIFAATYVDGYVWFVTSTRSLCKAPFNEETQTIGAYETVVSMLDQYRLFVDMAYNPMDGKLYFLCQDSQYNACLKSVSLTTPSQIEAVGDFSVRLWTLAINGQGQAYGIAYEGGDLYRINLADATTTLVGPTGKEVWYTQSMAFDLETGALYWAQLSAPNDHGFFQVNTQTGAATALGEIGASGAQLTGLFMIAESAAPQAGGEVIDFETGDFSQFPFNNSFDIPWQIFEEGSGNLCMRSGNKEQHSTTSAIEATCNFPEPGYIYFDGKCRGEGTSTLNDKCRFYIDGTLQFEYGATGSVWNSYTFEVTEGSHIFKWEYAKDANVNPEGDYFAVDNIMFATGSPCMAPTNLTVTTDLTDATVSWNGNAASYTLRFKLVTDNEWITVPGITETIYYLLDLAYGEYVLEIQSDCDEGNWTSITFAIEPEPTVINEIFILGFTAPSWGAHPDYDLEVDPDSHYTIADVKWHRNNDNGDVVVEPEEYFNLEDVAYYLYVLLSPKDGFVFDEHPVVYFDGDDSAFDVGSPSYHDYRVYTIEYRVTNPTCIVEHTERLVLWPNPAGPTLHLEGVEGEMVSVYDNTGRLVIQQRYESQLDLSNLVPGIYAVNVAGRTMKFAKK